MRNAIEIEGGLIITTDNSGGIGEKQQDAVAVPDRLTAYYAARVALLEQWAANAEPLTVLIHNFSGSKSWKSYVEGVQDLFQEAELERPTISGSTETNMELLQSAVAVTMIGKRQSQSQTEESKWFTYGIPLVGNEVKERPNEVASIRKIRQAFDNGMVQRIWPVGSGGIVEEARKMLGNEEARVDTILDCEKTAGPSTVVFLAIPLVNIEEAKTFFGNTLSEIHIAYN